MNQAEQHVHKANRRAEAFTREETYAATRRPVALAETLLPEAYTSEAFFALERERAAGRRVGARAHVHAGRRARHRRREPLTIVPTRC
jgi:hypothetical protein